ERDAIRVARLLLDLEAARATRAQARLDLALVMIEPLLEVEIARVVRVSELVAHDDLLLDRAVERIAGRVGPAVLHRLQHPGHVVDVALLRGAGIELALDPVEARLQESRLREIRVAGRIDRAELEPAATRDPDEGRTVLPAVVLVDRRPEPEVPKPLVRVHRR